MYTFRIGILRILGMFMMKWRIFVVSDNRKLRVKVLSSFLIIYDNCKKIGEEYLLYERKLGNNF